MRVVIAGGHGQIALRLGRLLAGRGDAVVGIIRNPDQSDDLVAAGMEPAVIDLETADVAPVAELLAGADAAVFAAGAGPGSGAPRKDTVDRGAAVLLADACEAAGVDRLIQVGSIGAEEMRGTEPSPDDDVFAVYLRAKLGAEDDLRRRDLAWTILRPGHLTDDPGTGLVRLAPSVPRGPVPRDDVAAVLLALLDEPRTAGRVLTLVSGDTPIAKAVAAV
jgi:uncharacterized protein YbjT (DUF2867 family)